MLASGGWAAVTGRAWSMITLLVASIVLIAVGWLRCEGAAPGIDAEETVRVGRNGAMVAVEAFDADSGVRQVRATLRHAGGEQTLLDESLGGNPLVGTRERVTRRFEIPIDPKTMGLAEGEAHLDIEAVDWSWNRMFRGNAAERRITLAVDLTPPRIDVSTGLTYTKRGGAGAVAYSVTENIYAHGVLVDGRLYPGYPLPDGRMVAIFAIPRDAPPNPEIRVVAQDASGNGGIATWPVRVQERQFEDVQIRLSHGFLNGKVAALANALGVSAPTSLEAFQKINRDQRAADEERIRELLGESEARALFSGGFEQLRNSAVTSRFAEHRTYVLDGEPVSEAIHYGYDLASTSGAPITAANAGRVLYADTLGIYGGCVLVDHGLGVTSLYAHLERIDVGAGDAVSRGQPLGTSGETGLAGGDHLHFAILVGGTYVDPVEWWDAKWVRERIESRLATE